MTALELGYGKEVTFPAEVTYGSNTYKVDRYGKIAAWGESQEKVYVEFHAEGVLQLALIPIEQLTLREGEKN